MRIEREIGQWLERRGLTLAVAESCTGGLIGHRVTSVAGSSAYFPGGVIAYSNEVKMRQLAVPRRMLARHGAVSGPVARRMAEGVRKLCRADVGLAVTGIAGPGGGTARKPVGLVYAGVSGPSGSRARRFRFRGNRAQIKKNSSQAALELLRDFIRQPGE